MFFIAVSISVILRVSCESEEEQSVNEPMEDQTGSQARKAVKMKPLPTQMVKQDVVGRGILTPQT